MLMSFNEWTQDFIYHTRRRILIVIEMAEYIIYDMWHDQNAYPLSSLCLKFDK